jgi:hypothetical protein
MAAMKSRQENLMTKSAIGHLVLAALAMGVAAAVTGTSAYAQANKRVSVYDSRPLAEAYLELVKQTGSLVTFEDAYYEYKGEMVDFSSEVHPLNPARKRPELLFAPLRRALVFDYSGADVAKPDVLFANLVSTYHRNSFENDFRLVREEQWLHILPKSSKNAKGERIERTSRLDVRVTFPDAERTVEATIRLLVDTLNKTASLSTRILFGVGGERLFGATRVRAGAQNETARHVLMRVLESTGHKVPWVVLCSFDPTPDRRTGDITDSCGLSFTVLD